MPILNSIAFYAIERNIIEGHISDPELIDTNYFLEEEGSDVSSEKEELTEDED
ncbi:MAG: hypothetical protein ON057_002000 [Glomeribacter sp. 1016415]|nr:hypothetical protein [Glomeribacter sp. 1016415]